jgi:hypothetical protein
MIMDVAHQSLYKPPQINDNPHAAYRQFLKLKLYSKRIDAVHLSNILGNKKVQSCIP